jgi:hypothetical protein
MEAKRHISWKFYATKSDLLESAILYPGRKNLMGRGGSLGPTAILSGRRFSFGRI